MLKKIVLAAVAVILVAAIGVFAAFKLSPWPSVWLIRHSFDQGAQQAIASVAPQLPEGVSVQRDLAYAPGRDTRLDVFAPADARAPLPTVVWVHGGGFVAGSRADLSGYLQVLAARGFVAVAVDYTLAPEARFPTPVQQTHAALAYLVANAQRFHIDPRRIFLAGDSAGAQIAAQAALATTTPAYAQRLGVTPGLARGSLRGAVLFCGPYDPSTMNFQGPFGDFMRTVIWSYIGTRDPRDPRVARMAVAPHVTAAYPPTFISVGNADPLAPQSLALADALRAQGVEVDALFYPADHQPPLAHEYQLLLSTRDGRASFERMVGFLQAHMN